MADKEKISSRLLWTFRVIGIFFGLLTPLSIWIFERIEPPIIFLILCIFSFNRGFQTSGRLRRAGVRAMVSYFFILLFIFFVPPSASRLNFGLGPLRNAGICEGRLREIAFALYQYAQDNDGNLPATLEQFARLYPEYILEPLVFYSPSDTDSPPDDITNVIPNAPNSAQISYTYTPGLTTASDPLTVILRDNTPANHLGSGIHVLYVNGRVAWQPEPGEVSLEWKNFIQTTNWPLMFFILLASITTIHWFILFLFTLKRK